MVSREGRDAMSLVMYNTPILVSTSVSKKGATASLPNVKQAPS